MSTHITWIIHTIMNCQAPDKFVAAAIRNPVCNLSLMVGTTDIPDWCYVGAYGNKGKSVFTEAPSAEHLAVLHGKSPISHVSKVCVYHISFFTCVIDEVGRRYRYYDSELED